MKFFRFPMFAFLSVLLVTYAVAQGPAASKPVPETDAQKAFDLMKGLAGNWIGSVTTDSPAWSTDKPMPLTIRGVSRGNAVVHELSTPGPEITVFYVENDHLMLTHYCDFANRPHMTAQPSPDGKTVEFNLVNFTGSDQIGHVSHALLRSSILTITWRTGSSCRREASLYMPTWISSVYSRRFVVCRRAWFAVEFW